MRKMARGEQFVLNRLLILNPKSRESRGQVDIRILFSLRRGKIKGFQSSICREFTMLHINKAKIFIKMIVPRGEHQAEDPLAIITRSVKVDFPKFGGSNPSGWIYKANKFFYFHKAPYNQRLILAFIHMEGHALVWYQDLAMSSYLPNWTFLIQSLM
jgi:hypothetical protein